MFNNASPAISQKRNLTHHWGLIAAGAVSLGGYLGMFFLHQSTGTLRDQYTPITLIWYALAFGGYLLALIWVEKRREASLSIIWSAAILFRLLLLFTVPTLSDDIYRYLWDGHVAINGVSPYAYPIDAPNLDHLDVPIRALANNRWMASPYMPTAQLLFSGLTSLFPLRPIFLQITMVAFDLLAGLLIARLLVLAGHFPHWVIIYLWSPLVIVEVAHSGHIDALMVFLMLTAIWATFSPRQGPFTTWLGPIALALATLTKILPMILLPILFWRWRWRQLFLFGLLTIGLLLPFGMVSGWGLTGPLDGTGLFGALRIYSDQWNFNSGLFHWFEANLLPAVGVIEANTWAKRLVLVILLLVLGLVGWAGRRTTGILANLRLMSIPFMAYILLTTTVHPWYLLILMVFLPFLAPAPHESPWRWLILAPWLYLSGAVALSYITYINPLDFREYEWVRNSEWLPTLALLTLTIVLYPYLRSTGRLAPDP